LQTAAQDSVVSSKQQNDGMEEAKAADLISNRLYLSGNTVAVIYDDSDTINPSAADRLFFPSTFGK